LVWFAAVTTCFYRQIGLSGQRWH